MTDEYVHVFADKICTCIHTLQYGVKKPKKPIQTHYLIRVSEHVFVYVLYCFYFS